MHVCRSRRGIAAVHGAPAAGVFASAAAKNAVATSPLAVLLPSIDYMCGNVATDVRAGLVKRACKHKISRDPFHAATWPTRSRFLAAGRRHAGGGAVVLPRQEA